MSAPADRRAAVVSRLAERIAGRWFPHPTRVAVDGITASGKSTLARELSVAVEALDRPTLHLSMDGFHHPRARRHQQGRDSAIGYYEDAYDFGALAREVLIPLGPSGDRRYRSSIIDLASDAPTDEQPITAPGDAVLIIDGTFLQRPELFDHWDERIWVNTSPSIARQRGAHRDATALGGHHQAERLFALRYHAACQLYIDDVHPEQRATVVIDNDDLTNPELQLR